MCSEEGNFEDILVWRRYFEDGMTEEDLGMRMTDAERKVQEGRMLLLRR